VSEIVTSGPLLVALGLAVLAGLVSFASPCVLPLVPGFLGYITGMSPEPGSGGSTRGRGRLLAGAALFVAGFSAVFILMGLVVTSLGLAMQRHQDLLLRLGGILVLVLGAVMVLAPAASWRPRWRPAAGLAGAPLVGVVFGLGFSACTGPVLASIQTLAASLPPYDDVLGRGLSLSVAYCVGLGLPFLLIAAGLGWVARASRWLRDRHRVIQTVGGTALALLGVLMVTGVWEQLTAWMQTQLISDFSTVI
jgi:cytochrome c-type biogenesis protein